MIDLSALYDAIINGDEKLAVRLVKTALAEAVQASELIQRWMIPAMDEIGKRFAAHEYYIPEILLSARAMKSGLELLRPMLSAAGAQPAGRVVIGTVQGDLHDIGKNIVAAMLEAAGFEVTDLGIDVSGQKFIQAVRDQKPDILALSALLTTTMPEMKKIIDELSRTGLRNKVKVIVGGAPVTASFAVEIGADGYGENAAAAVTIARSLVRK